MYRVEYILNTLDNKTLYQYITNSKMYFNFKITLLIVFYPSFQGQKCEKREMRQARARRQIQKSKTFF